ncbi:MAG: hypothetical protein RLZZ397_791 [Pseudomonadota bacterium]|jgi:sulfide dehydrogenase cytochrome subunit
MNSSQPSSSPKTNRSTLWVLVLIVAGALVGIWLTQSPKAPTSQQAATAQPAAAVSAPVPAATMAHSCAACHGTNGQLADEFFAPLAGMPVDQFVNTMIDFREGRRPATLMGLVAKGFSDQDIQLMGEFFATQTKGVQP